MTRSLGLLGVAFATIAWGLVPLATNSCKCRPWHLRLTGCGSAYLIYGGAFLSLDAGLQSARCSLAPSVACFLPATCPLPWRPAV
jgi:hypothetical protein